MLGYKQRVQMLLVMPRYIQSLNLRNITPRMVLAPHFKSRGGVSNSLPPKTYWQKLGADS